MWNLPSSVYSTWWLCKKIKPAAEPACSLWHSFPTFRRSNCYHNCTSMRYNTNATARRTHATGEILSPWHEIGHQAPSATEDVLSARAADLSDRIMLKLQTWTLCDWLPRLHEVQSEGLLEDMNEALQSIPTSPKLISWSTPGQQWSQTHLSIRIKAMRSSILHGEGDYSRSSQWGGLICCRAFLPSFLPFLVSNHAKMTTGQ